MSITTINKALSLLPQVGGAVAHSSSGGYSCCCSWVLLFHIHLTFYWCVTYMWQPRQVINTRVNPLQPATVDQKKNNNDRTQLHPDWYASKKSLQERNAVMLNNDLLADVYFIVGSGSTQRRIPAHKYILVTGSSVFHAMFCGGLPEEKEVAIPDVEPQAFLNLLKWVYDLRINWFESNMEMIVARSCGVVSCRFVGKKTQLIST